MTISELKTKQDEKQFLEFPRSLYKNDPNFISPLDSDVKSVFDPKLNNFHNHGICKRWLAKDTHGKTIGRIAAFINYEKNKDPQQVIGGAGFFESIRDENVAFKLFDTARDWLISQKAIGMDGPVNFGQNDKYWGLLVEGFVRPSMGMNYNHPYYIEYFEKYGFEKQYDQYTNVIHLSTPFPERFNKIANWIASKPGYRFEHFKRDEFENFAKDFQEIYNDAWSDFADFVPMQLNTIRDSFRSMKPIVDEKIIWFAYHEQEPIAFIIALPDINQVLRKVNGRLDLIGKLKYLWYKNSITIDRIRFIVMGCKKKFQNKGIESGMIKKLEIEVLPRNTIKEVELAWVGDFNPKMIALHEATGASREKVHRTYRYTFNRSATSD